MFRVTQGSTIHLDHRAYQHKSCRSLQPQIQQVFHLVLLCSLGKVPKHWAVKIRKKKKNYMPNRGSNNIVHNCHQLFPRDSNLAQEVVIERIIGKVCQISSNPLFCFCTKKIHWLVILPKHMLWKESGENKYTLRQNDSWDFMALIWELIIMDPILLVLFKNQK